MCPSLVTWADGDGCVEEGSRAILVEEEMRSLSAPILHEAAIGHVDGGVEGWERCVAPIQSIPRESVVARPSTVPMEQGMKMPASVPVQERVLHRIVEVQDRAKRVRASP